MSKDKDSYQTRFEKLREEMFYFYRTEPNFRRLPYSNLNWLKCSLENVGLLIKMEGLLDSDRFSLMVGSLIQDIGLLHMSEQNPGVYTNHSEIGARITHSFLKQRGYQDEEIPFISEIISKSTSKNENEQMLSNILYDANVGYHFGSRKDFWARYLSLRNELKGFGNAEVQDEAYCRKQLETIKAGFSGDSAKLLWDAGREQNIQLLEKELEKRFKPKPAPKKTATKEKPTQVLNQYFS